MKSQTATVARFSPLQEVILSMSVCSLDGGSPPPVDEPLPDHPVSFDYLQELENSAPIDEIVLDAGLLFHHPRRTLAFSFVIVYASGRVAAVAWNPGQSPGAHREYVVVEELDASPDREEAIERAMAALEDWIDAIPSINTRPPGDRALVGEGGSDRLDYVQTAVALGWPDGGPDV